MTLRLRGNFLGGPVIADLAIGNVDIFGHKHLKIKHGVQLDHAIGVGVQRPVVE